MVYVTHKFRAAIGKSKLIRDGETVLVGVSGGQASSCLLHLIQEVCKATVKNNRNVIKRLEDPVKNPRKKFHLCNWQELLEYLTGILCYHYFTPLFAHLLMEHIKV